MQKFLFNKKIIISVILLGITILILLLKNPLLKQYKKIKLNHINKDIILEGEYLSNNHTNTYIGSSIYIDIHKKRAYLVKYFVFSDGHLSEESLINDKKLSDDEYNAIMDIISASSTKKPKSTKDFELCYKIIYNNKVVYTNSSQTNDITNKILWKLHIEKH